MKWLKKNNIVSLEVLRKCLFTFTLPHLAWIFPLYPFLPQGQREALNRKFRVGIRIAHRCPYIAARDLHTVTKEESLEFYVKRYIRKQITNANKTDPSRSPFFEDIFKWDGMKKKKNDGVGHFFRTRRVKKQLERHEVLLIKWIEFTA